MQVYPGISTYHIISANVTLTTSISMYSCPIIANIYISNEQ